MKPSTKARDPNEPNQLRLPGAVKLDPWGTHAYECECARCELGARPTPAERDRLRRTWEAMQAARKKAAGDGLPLTKDEERHVEATVRLEVTERETAERIARMVKPVERPATPEELAALKAEFGFGPKKKG